MLKHMSQFNVKESLSEDEVQALLRSMQEKVSTFPEAQLVRVYKQICSTNPFQYCIEVTFASDDLACIDRYLNNDAHDAFCDEVWFPNVVNQLDMNIVQAY